MAETKVCYMLVNRQDEEAVFTSREDLEEYLIGMLEDQAFSDFNHILQNGCDPTEALKEMEYYLDRHGWWYMEVPIFY